MANQFPNNMLQWEGSREGEERDPEQSIVDGDEGGQLRVEVPSNLSLDDAFDILSNQRRRHVLQYLLDADADSVELGEIAEHVAALENDKDTSTLTSNERKRVYVGLYQNHLPRMDAVDVIEFDADRKQIRLGTNATELERYLQCKPRGTPGGTGSRWPLYYFLVAVCSVLAVLGSLLINGFSTNHRVLLAAGTIACFVVLPLVQLVQQRR